MAPASSRSSDPRRSYKMTLAYDGRAYKGWQLQVNETTVQGTMQRALAKLAEPPIELIASGRTDAGVHALGQVASLKIASSLEAFQLQRALNSHLPTDIRVLDLVPASAHFHAIRDATGKCYRYVIQDGIVADVFQRHYCWFVPGRLDEVAMQQAADSLRGTHDFASYQGSGSPRKSTVRTISEFTVRRRAGEGGSFLVLEVAANGFLYNMVRNLVGTLVEVGRGRRSVEWPRSLLQVADRKQAGRTAPPQGLYLLRVEYAGGT